LGYGTGAFEVVKTSKPIRFLGFLWRRTGDASVLAWIVPGYWGKGLVVLTGLVATALEAWRKASPLEGLLIVVGAMALCILAVHLFQAILRGMKTPEEGKGGSEGRDIRSASAGRDISGIVVMGDQHVHHAPPPPPVWGKTEKQTAERNSKAAELREMRLLLKEQNRTTTKAIRDTKLGDAIAYIVTRKWDSKPTENSDDAKQMNEALAKLRQAALDEDLRVWGRNYTSSIYEPIDPYYWAKYEVDFLSLFRPEAHVFEDALPNPNYRGLMVSKAEIEALWPPQTPQSASEDKHAYFLFLQAAVRTAFENIEDATFGKFLAAKPPEERVGWIVSVFQAYGPLWGCVWPSQNLRLLDRKGQQSARWKPGTNTLLDLVSENVLYENVCLKKEDLQEHIQRMRGWTTDDINNGRW
jgi:hypothetical protein